MRQQTTSKIHSVPHLCTDVHEFVSLLRCMREQRYMHVLRPLWHLDCRAGTSLATTQHRFLIEGFIVCAALRCLWLELRCFAGSWAARRSRVGQTPMLTGRFGAFEG